MDAVNYSLERCMGNNHTPTSKELRGVLNRFGVDTDGMKQSRMILEVGKLERKKTSLRSECVRRGLSDEGTMEELKLRLDANQEDSVSKSNRWAYWSSVLGGLFLAMAGLAVSLPSIAMELATQMGTSLFVGVCLALIIDGGFIIFKVIDNLNEKFKFSTYQRVIIWTLMVTCLLMSAALNASKFMRVEGANPYIQIPLALFISGFIFAMASICAGMVVRCEPKVADLTEEESGPAKLRRIAAEMENRGKVAGKLV